MKDWQKIQAALQKAKYQTLAHFGMEHYPIVDALVTEAQAILEDQPGGPPGVTVAFQLYGYESHKPLEQVWGIPMSQWQYIAKMLRRAKYGYQAYRDDTRELLGASPKVPHDGRKLLFGNSTKGIG